MLIPTMDGKDLRGRVLRVRVQEVVDEARGGQKKSVVKAGSSTTKDCSYAYVDAEVE